MTLMDTLDPKNLAVIKNLISTQVNRGKPFDPGEYKMLISHAELGSYIRTFYDSFKENSDGGIGKKANPANLADYIFKEFPYIVLDNVFYIYENGVFRKDNKSVKMQLIISNLLKPEERNPSIMKNTMDQLKVYMVNQKTVDQVNTHKLHYICFQNGVYDPIQKKMLKHSPEYQFINQIPHEFHPEKPLPESKSFESFMQSIGWTPEERKMFLAYVGLCMTTDTRLQKMLVMKGLPGSGKSLMTNFITHVIGSENTASRDLSRLSNPDEKFYSYGLMGKLINASSELQTLPDKPIDPTMIKRLTGEDIVSVEPKGIDAYEIRPYARHIFLTNGYPSIRARDGSFFRRLLVLPFDKVPEHENSNLLYELMEDTDYFIRIAVSALEEYYQLQDKNSIETESSKKMKQEWWLKSDSVYAFLVDRNPMEGSSKMRKTELFSLYEKYCVEMGRSPLRSNQEFYESMKNKGYQETVSDGYSCFKNPYYQDKFYSLQDADDPFFLANEDGQDG